MSSDFQPGDPEGDVITYEPMSRAPAHLRWVKVNPGLYDLVGGEQYFASLELNRLQATATTADGEWLLRKPGLLRGRITVKDKNSLQVVGALALRGADSGLFLDADGKTRLSTLVWSHRSRTWSSEEDWLIRFYPGGESSADLFKFQFDVELYRNARDLPELSLLTVLGWYALLVTRP